MEPELYQQSPSCFINKIHPQQPISLYGILPSNWPYRSFEQWRAGWYGVQPSNKPFGGEGCARHATIRFQQHTNSFSHPQTLLLTLLGTGCFPPRQHQNLDTVVTTTFLSHTPTFKPAAILKAQLEVSKTIQQQFSKHNSSYSKQFSTATPWRH